MYEFLWNTGCFLLLISILLIVTICDYRYFRIPDQCCFTLACLGIAESIRINRSWVECMMGFWSINSLLLIVYLVTRKKGIGGGDIKLFAASGLFLGWQKNIIAFLVASISVLIHWFFRRDFIIRYRKLAFGPYISFGILFSYLIGDWFIQWYMEWPGIHLTLF